MKKTTTTCIWITDEKYLIVSWVGGDYYSVQRWVCQRCTEDTLEGVPEYLTKSQIRGLIQPREYKLRTYAPATEWLGYALNKGINPEQARTRLSEGGVL